MLLVILYIKNALFIVRVTLQTLNRAIVKVQSPVIYLVMLGASLSSDTKVYISFEKNKRKMM